MGCANSLELATANETALKAKKQASERTTFNNDDRGKRKMEQVKEALTLLDLTN